jgi:hypothetical protein
MKILTKTLTVVTSVALLGCGVQEKKNNRTTPTTPAVVGNATEEENKGAVEEDSSADGVGENTGEVSYEEEVTYEDKREEGFTEEDHQEAKNTTVSSEEVVSNNAETTLPSSSESVESTKASGGDEEKVAESKESESITKTLDNAPIPFGWMIPDQLAMTSQILNWDQLKLTGLSWKTKAGLQAYTFKDKILVEETPDRWGIVQVEFYDNISTNTVGAEWAEIKSTYTN